ncbi:MAG TPA: DNA-processing protein DprA [Candidatus Lumbricidophila sp.]|nr:DNA-processing protein DprA [Candidatus Lumbricidophila sp.]
MITRAIPASFHQIWNGPAEQTEAAYTLAMLNILFETGDPRIGQAFHDGTTAALFESIESGSQFEGFTSDELLNARQDLSYAERSFDTAAQHNISLITAAEAAIPEQFADLEAEMPVVLWLRGNPVLLDTMANGVTIAGARAATGYGEHIASEIAQGACDVDLTVVSGGAYGIDGAAHRTAIYTGGKTIWFAASGLTRAYPAGHDALFEKVLEFGLAISEQAPGTSPTRARFLRRNRLLAAATNTTVIVEAGFRSASLQIASAARDLGRVVTAVPGPVTSASSSGTHRLIKWGIARLVTDWEDIAELRDPTTATIRTKAPETESLDG